MNASANYAEKVYAGVLGKIIGVYLGQPFEGWSNEKIERELGEIKGYVNDKLNRPLVVTDDDISGTLTFIRALEDHKCNRSITSAQIGKTWLNYLIEYENVLWWGGMGVSTEHTAWLRLKAGLPAPRSGAIETNGRVVAEQIGAQIFIDGWAMVAPGDPALAVELAGKAGRVSHDGAAVHGAQAVAAMEALAFVEHDMTKLLDAALGFLPADSIIAAVHRDVRAWAASHGDDWRLTFAKIRAKYGYDKFGGGCHIVPNHAVMVMAWAHAPNNFSHALTIGATAGWDTDCNLANIGCLMGIKEGLAGLRAHGYDWQTPFADRVVIPTAEGTHSISDALREADMLTRMGRRMMGWRAAPPPKKGARFHFSQPGALHGFMTENAALAEVANTADTTGSRHMQIAFKGVAADKPARVSTPTYLTPDWLNRSSSAYATGITPILYNGQQVSAVLSTPHTNPEATQAALFIRYYTAMGKVVETAEQASPTITLTPGTTGKIKWTVPETAGRPIAQLGIIVSSGGDGIVNVEHVTWSGSPTINYSSAIFRAGHAFPHGWRPSTKVTTCMRTHDTFTELISNQERVTLATGTTDWTDYTVSANVDVHVADATGLAVRYGGLLRFLALEFNPRSQQLQLVRHYDGKRRILNSTPCTWQFDEKHTLKLTVKGQQAIAYADGEKVLESTFRGLSCGGMALFTEIGRARFQEITVQGES